MVSIIGYLLISFSILSSVFSVVAFLLSLEKKSQEWSGRGSVGLWISSGFLFGALFLLFIAFISNNFQIAYIALHSNRSLPVHLKISAIWAGQEGSLLLWAFLQVTFAAIVGNSTKRENNRLELLSVIILIVITLFFSLMTIIFSNPFIPLDNPLMDGQGMNPLLRHPAMVLHPPILYVGYVGLAVPFAFAMAGLIDNKVDEWPLKIRGWLLVSWIALGAGIILGARWAYDVLGWGGYWGWDPVENAGLMPWLTATALLHGLSHQVRGKGFKAWNVSLAALSFLLVLFGTFTTRSGLIQSVHAFTRSPSGLYFFGFILFTLFFVILIIVTYRKSFGTLIYPDAIFSREGMAFFTLMLLVLITLSVLSGTLLPTLTNGRFVAPPAWFNRVIGPQLGFLVLLMGICPFFGRYGRLVRKIKWLSILPILGFTLASLFAHLLEFREIYAIFGFAIAGFAGGVALGEILSQLLNQSKNNENNKKKWTKVIPGRFGIGAHILHFGVVLMAMGVIGTQMFSQEQNFTLSLGESATIENYVLVYEDLFQESGGDHLESKAVFSIYKENDYIGELHPKIAYYPLYDQAIAEPDLITSFREDLYLVLFQWLPSGIVSINVMINPLSNFLWVGSILLLLGGILVWLPANEKVFEKFPQHKKLSDILIVSVGLVFIGIIIFAMWGNNINFDIKKGRPLPGQMAPQISAVDMNGIPFSSEDCSGKVVVLHFWATWCEQCEEELIMLNEVMGKMDRGDVCFVGIALNDTRESVASMVIELGISFLIIPDPEGELSYEFGVRAVPETFILNNDGSVAFLKIGVMEENILISEIKSLISD
jgi:cytochrome c-type biogenesis protein CcmF